MQSNPLLTSHIWWMIVQVVYKPRALFQQWKMLWFCDFRFFSIFRLLRNKIVVCTLCSEIQRCCRCSCKIAKILFRTKECIHPPPFMLFLNLNVLLLIVFNRTLNAKYFFPHGCLPNTWPQILGCSRWPFPGLLATFPTFSLFSYNARLVRTHF